MPTQKPIEKTERLTAETEFKTIGFFTVNNDGCKFRFNIEQTHYMLKQSHDNFNALYALLLGTFLNRDRVQVTYSTIRVAGSDETFNIISATAWPS